MSSQPDHPATLDAGAARRRAEDPAPAAARDHPEGRRRLRPPPQLQHRDRRADGTAQPRREVRRHERPGPRACARRRCRRWCCCSTRSRRTSRHALWQALGHAETLLEDVPFPQADPAALVRDAVTLAVQVNGKLRGTIEVPVNCRREEIERAGAGRAERRAVPRGPDGEEGDRRAGQDRQHRRDLHDGLPARRRPRPDWQRMTFRIRSSTAAAAAHGLLSASCWSISRLRLPSAARRCTAARLGAVRWFGGPLQSAGRIAGAGAGPRRATPAGATTDIGRDRAGPASERWGDHADQRRRVRSRQEYSLRYAVIFEMRAADGTKLVPRQTHRTGPRLHLQPGQRRSAPRASARSCCANCAARWRLRSCAAWAPSRAGGSWATVAPGRAGGGRCGQGRAGSRRRAGQSARRTRRRTPTAPTRSSRADGTQAGTAGRRSSTAGPLRPAYLIAGPEPLRVLEAADAVRAAARAQGISEREVFEAEGNQREPDWDALESSFRAPSLFSSRRLVELRLPTGKPGKEGARSHRRVLRRSAGRRDPAGHRRRLEQAARRQVERGDRARRPDRDRLGGQAARTAGLDRAPPARARPARRSRRGAAAGRTRRGQPARRGAGDRQAGAAVATGRRRARCRAHGGPGRRCRALRCVPPDRCRDERAGRAGLAHARRPACRRRGGAGAARHGRSRNCSTAALARVQARGGNLAAEFKAQRIWDSKQPMYRRALQRHDATALGCASWPRPGGSIASPRAVGVAARSRTMPGSRWSACCLRSPNRAPRACWPCADEAAVRLAHEDCAEDLLRRHLRSGPQRPPADRPRGARCAGCDRCTCCPPPTRRTRAPTHADAAPARAHARPGGRGRSRPEGRSPRTAPGGPSYTIDTLLELRAELGDRCRSSG